MERYEHVNKKLARFLPSREELAFAEVLFAEGIIAASRSDIDSALEHYQAALLHDPKLVWAWINMGTIKFEQKDLMAAERCYHRALEIDPNCVMGYFNLAVVAGERSNYCMAVELYRKALAINPGYAAAHFNLACVYGKLEEWQKNVRHYRLFLAHCDSNENSYCLKMAHDAIGNYGHYDLQIVRRALPVSAAHIDDGDVPICVER